MLRVIVTGANGQLGYDVIKKLKKRGIKCFGVDKSDFDITDFKAVSLYFSTVKPTHVVHCAAYTFVDKAEDEPFVCEKVNVDGTRNIAKLCRYFDATMVYISTDYVFDGHGKKPFQVTDAPLPLNIYGKSKLMGELCVASELQKYFIIRTSWAFGENGGNFVKTMLRLGKEYKEIQVVDDQIGSPTYTMDLADLLIDMIMTDKYGIYHATNEGYCSWADFAVEIFDIMGYNTRVKRITSEQYLAKAERPKNSRLSKDSLDKTGFKRLPNWKDSIKSYLKTYFKQSGE